MSTIGIQAKVPNLDSSNPLTVLGANLGCCVSEMNIYCAGVKGNKIQFQNRLETMLKRLIPWDKRVTIYDSGFGYASGDINGQFVLTAIPAEAHGH